MRRDDTIPATPPRILFSVEGEIEGSRAGAIVDHLSNVGDAGVAKDNASSSHGGIQAANPRRGERLHEEG